MTVSQSHTPADEGSSTPQPWTPDTADDGSPDARPWTPDTADDTSRDPEPWTPDTALTSNPPEAPEAADPTNTVDAAKAEASGIKDTAVHATEGVVDVAKDEAGSVAREAKASARQLYAQTRQELGDQAAKQQDRLATGLRSVGDQFGQMANGQSGVAGELAGRASMLTTGAGAWLASRDPAGVLTEVKSFARRRPAVFIAGAAVAGILVGRRVRAHASAAAADSSTAVSPGPAPAALPQLTDSAPTSAESAESAGRGETDTALPMPAEMDDAAVAEAPVYAEAATRLEDDHREARDE